VTTGFGYFKHVLLVASPEDKYVPYHSARIELHEPSQLDAKWSTSADWAIKSTGAIGLCFALHLHLCCISLTPLDIDVCGMHRARVFVNGRASVAPTDCRCAFFAPWCIICQSRSQSRRVHWSRRAHFFFGSDAIFVVFFFSLQEVFFVSIL
jgi:hypothetical protein